MKIHEIVDKIESILREKLDPKHWQRHYKHLSVQISVLLFNIKRSFLWDIGPVQRLTNLIEIVKEINKEFDCELFVVIMNTDKFIVNQRLLPINPNLYVFIDVSKDLSTPRIMESDVVTEFVKNLNEKLNKRQESIEIDPEPGVCVPCMTGLLIGYPVIYFYDKNSNGENCLQNVELNVQQVRYRDFVLTSFSIPKELLEGSPFIQSTILEWKNQMKLMPELEFESFDKNLDVVIL